MTTPPSNPDNIREEAVNTHLAQLLQERGVPARAERRGVRGAPDVAIELPDGGLILLECKWQGDATPLERQLGDRLRDFPEAVGLVGILYPDGIRQEADTRAALERASGLQWWLHGTRGIAAPERQVRRGRVADLADHLRALPLELEGVDRVQAAAGVIGYAVEQAARGISGDHWIVETKGLEDVEVALKDARARQWSRDASALTGVRWGYLKVHDRDFRRSTAQSFWELAAEIQTAAPQR